MDFFRYPTGVSDAYLTPKICSRIDRENRTPRQTVPGFSGTAYVCPEVRSTTVLAKSWRFLFNLAKKGILGILTSGKPTCINGAAAAAEGLNILAFKRE